MNLSTRRMTPSSRALIIVCLFCESSFVLGNVRASSILLEGESVDNDTSSENHTKVVLSVYYETLCPYSMELFRKQLIPVWNSLGEEYLDLRLIPYGNSHTFFQPGFIMTGCQHGEMECFGNKVHACVLEYLPTDVARDFIFCTMSQESPPAGVTNCSAALAPEFNFIPTIMDACVDVFAGQLAVALRGLQSLDFVNDGVPSIAVNGVVAEGDEPFDDLLTYMCTLLPNPPRQKRLPGFQLPEACRKK